MLNSLIRIKDFCWRDGAFCADSSVDDVFTDPAQLDGQFGVAAVDGRNGRIRLVRDRLGINKLFFAIEPSNRVTVGNYLVDLVASGIPVAQIYSVPAGHALDIDLEAKELSASRYFSVKLTDADFWGGLEGHALWIREDLDRWFAKLADQFGQRSVCVCVSGGLDSGLIAALANRYFTKVTFYTYGFVGGEGPTDDAVYGRRLAEFLRRPSRYVPAGAAQVLGAIDRALLYGQDWRDFNVHCAMVNELVAQAIRQDWIDAGEGEPPLVLTGDLMNEILADYTTVHYDGRTYYRVPRLELDALRTVLIKGLDAGDREVGVFARHGLDLIQPYGLLIDRFLDLPSALVTGPDPKQRLMRAIAGDLLPAWIFERGKVRAQIGSAKEPVGILPLMHEAGYDAGWLQTRFAQIAGVENASSLKDFIRSGRYRSTTMFPAGRA
jgi:asparagine synthetase B (glutamine-hydrolysing)